MADEVKYYKDCEVEYKVGRFLNIDIKLHSCFVKVDKSWSYITGIRNQIHIAINSITTLKKETSWKNVTNEEQKLLNGYITNEEKKSITGYTYKCKYGQPITEQQYNRGRKNKKAWLTKINNLILKNQFESKLKQLDKLCNKHLKALKKK